MANAQMRCTQCGNEWHYRGMSSKTAYCPKCDRLNQIDLSALQVNHRNGIPY